MSTAVRSFWLDEALAFEDGAPAPVLEGSVRADVCIVGGGYCGLWTALELKAREPALEVVLLERDLCGAGASGRNAGYLLSWWAKFGALVGLCGETEALRLARAADDIVGEIVAFCDTYAIDADLRHDGWLWVASNPAQVGLWRETIAAIGAVHGGAPIVEWPPETVRERAISPLHRAVAFEQNAVRLQPALLARGLRRVALERGVRIFEHSPLKSLTTTDPAVVHTPRGQVTAARVVLAMNAWTARWPQVRKAIIVVSGDMIVTPPIPEALDELGWRDGLTMSDGRTLVHYYRTTRDRRLAFGMGGMSGRFSFGGRVGDEVEGRSEIERYLRDAMHRTFPSLARVSVAQSWRGPVDRSLSGLPFFWHLDDARHVYFAAGFSGNGIGATRLAGRILASLALGQRDEWSACPLVRAPQRDFPPEPFRYLGSHFIRRALLAKDHADDAGRVPPLAARLAVRFAPAGLSPFESDENAPPDGTGVASEKP